MDQQKHTIGAITWVDISVDNASDLKAFYQKVVGYSSVGVPMGEYEDYCMNSPSDDNTYAGICHNRGVNSNFPPYWMIYITVADLDQSVAEVIALGGKIIDGPKDQGTAGKYAIIQDPAGAYCGLYQYL